MIENVVEDEYATPRTWPAEKIGTAT